MKNPIEIFTGPWTNPFREVDRMRTAAERMFDLFPEVARRTGENGLSFSPACEVSEEENQYLIKFDIPGIPKEQVKIELVGKQLTVMAERREEKKKDTKKVHLEELNYGSYMRSFTLPEAVDEKRVDAKYEDGVLCISIPKVEHAKAKQIAVH